MNRIRKLSGILCLLAALLVCGAAQAQSLGQQARQLRFRKGPSAKPERVYTDDNMPRSSGAGKATTETPKEKAKEGEKAPAPAAPSPKSTADLEKEYRAKAAGLRATLEAEQKKWDELQKQWGLGRQQEVERQKAALDAAKKALDDLEDELRRKFLPPGWAR